METPPSPRDRRRCVRRVSSLIFLTTLLLAFSARAAEFDLSSSSTAGALDSAFAKSSPWLPARNAGGAEVTAAMAVTTRSSSTSSFRRSLLQLAYNPEILPPCTQEMIDNNDRCCHPQDTATCESWSSSSFATYFFSTLFLALTFFHFFELFLTKKQAVARLAIRIPASKGPLAAKTHGHCLAAGPVRAT